MSSRRGGVHLASCTAYLVVALLALHGAVIAVRVLWPALQKSGGRTRCHNRAVAVRQRVQWGACTVPLAGLAHLRVLWRPVLEVLERDVLGAQLPPLRVLHVALLDAVQQLAAAAAAGTQRRAGQARPAQRGAEWEPDQVAGEAEGARSYALLASAPASPEVVDLVRVPRRPRHDDRREGGGGP